eukprot:TRINITY_DN2674_c0_g1_i1.p3 TRINITY_DN2674_c0_g1~~TRINITY_DN2674_c0_g1_i1.p3  ORF type:complete len:158 (+),score=59.37 TRINITY_DN2674_c0_g1_i1:321-794(+)
MYSLGHADFGWPPDMDVRASFPDVYLPSFSELVDESPSAADTVSLVTASGGKSSPPCESPPPPAAAEEDGGGDVDYHPVDSGGGFAPPPLPPADMMAALTALTTPAVAPPPPPPPAAAAATAPLPTGTASEAGLDLAADLAAYTSDGCAETAKAHRG